MLKSYLRFLMAEHKINSVTELMNESGLSRNAINKLLKEENLESVKLETLIKLCNVFTCSLSKLIEYKPKRCEK